MKNDFSFVYENGIDGEKISISPLELKEAFSALCGYSVYSMEGSINNGYIPLAFGHRAGVCGSGYAGENGFSVKDITSVNIRIARSQSCTCPEELIKYVTKVPAGLLIAGAPSSGKTTMLKAVISALSSFNIRTSVVDERGELSPLNKTAPLHCDVFSLYPKSAGMLQAIRVMSPQVLVCDEIGGIEDARAVISAVNAGVGVITSAHAQCMQQLVTRPQIRAVLNTGAISEVCFLKGAHAPCEIERIEKICLH